MQKKEQENLETGDVCIYLTPLTMSRMKRKVFFKQSTSGLNAKFSFSLTSWLAKNTACPTINPLVGVEERTERNSYLPQEH